MEDSKDKALDVLIIGAGPAGLMMACQLALHNISFRIIDKKDSFPIYSGALIVHAHTMELFQQMGIAEKALKAGIIAQTINLHFNHKKNYSLDISGFGQGLTRYPFLLMIEQWKTESLLNQFLNEHGHWVEQGISLEILMQENNVVISQIRKNDGSLDVIKSRFLIGADGNNSQVRKQLGISFSGKTQESKLFVTDCEAKLPLSTRQILFSFAKDFTSGVFPLQENRWRVDGLIPIIQTEEVGFEEVRNYFGSKTNSEIELLQPRWFSVFRSHSRCADKFREKNCFLIGDAAHVHSPVGAQGMNTGIQDAHNLAWKLAYVIGKKAMAKVLDTYQAERRPLALNIIRYTDWAYSFISANSFLARLLRLRIVPLVLPMLFSWFNKNPGICNRIFISISGLGIRYKKSILSAPFAEGDFPTHSPKPGERLPYHTYEKRGKRASLHSGLAPTKFYLFVFGQHLLPAPFQMVLYKFKKVISLKYIAKEPSTQPLFKSFGIKDEGCYLVRPDLYIAWRCHGFDEEGLSNYLQNALK